MTTPAMTTTLTDPTTALAAAAEHYADAQAAHDALRYLYDTPESQRGPGFTHKVASLHDAIRHGLKSAEVAATIGLGLELVDVSPGDLVRARAKADRTATLRGRLAAARAGVES